MNVKQCETEFMNAQFRRGFFGLILKGLRLEVSLYDIYITQNTFAFFGGGGGGGEKIR